MNKLKPLVSVVIPVFNREDFLSEAIKSVINQQYTHWELIIVDDGSIDNSIEISKKWEEKYESISFYQRNRLPKGAPTCRNIGLSFAKGKYVQFLDSDDLLWEGKLSRQVKLMQQKNLDVLHGSYMELLLSKGRKHEFICKSSSNQWLNLFYGRGITSSNLFSRRCLLQIGGWDETKKSSQEPHLMFQMYKAGARASADLLISATIRVLESGITKTNQVGNYIRYAEYVFEVFNFLKKEELLRPEDRLKIDQTVFKVVRHLYRLDPDLGALKFEEYIRNGNIHPKGLQNLSLIYRVLYKLIGFTFTEWFYKYLGK